MSAELTHRPRPAGFLGRKDDELHLGVAALVQSHQALLERLTGLEAVAQAVGQLVAVPRQKVLWSGTATLNPAGIWTVNLRTGSKAIFVVNYSANDNVTVAASGPQGGPPGSGPGSHYLPKGAAAGFNNDTNDWTLYGTAGDSFDVQIFGVAIHPSAAGAI